ncbi:MAG: hypothetical protein HY366_00670 [Candidatus Aenigmarchaeota archaeon]|nr:hypothetical protein [Candidatus Aenigmarchaeota archaeon]
MRFDSERWFTILIVGVVGATLLGIPDSIISIFINGWMYLFIGAIFSYVAGNIVEGFSGDYLKGIFLNFEILGHHFSLSVFFITVAILSFWLRL